MATKKETEEKEPREEEEKEPKEGAVEVKLDDDDDDDEGDGGKASPADTTRSDRRRERGKERYAEVQRTAREAIERSERLERELHEERTRRTVEDAMRRQQAGAPRDDNKRYDEKMGDIRKRMSAKLQALRGVQDDGATQALAQEYQDLQGELEEARIERALARHGNTSAAPAVVNTEQSMLQYEFPDVFGDARKKRWASGVYEQLIADGAAEGLETAKQAARQTRQKYNGASSSAVPAAQQQRYAATPASGGAPPASTVVRIPNNLKKIARAKYPKLEEDEAYKRFARDLRRIEVA